VSTSWEDNPSPPHHSVIRKMFNSCDLFLLSRFIQTYKIKLDKVQLQGISLSQYNFTATFRIHERGRDMQTSGGNMTMRADIGRDCADTI
jgi:hypothetical protein